MSNKAHASVMETLHGEIAALMLSVLRGEKTITNDRGEEVLPTSPTFLNTVIKFLKDNSVTADIGTNKALKDLVDEIPDFEDDEVSIPR